MPDLLPYLDAAAAHPEFKRELLAFVRGGEAPRIELEGSNSECATSALP